MNGKPLGGTPTRAPITELPAPTKAMQKRYGQLMVKDELTRKEQALSTAVGSTPAVGAKPMQESTASVAKRGL